jgi:3-phytase
MEASGSHSSDNPPNELTRTGSRQYSARQSVAFQRLTRIGESLRIAAIVLAFWTPSGKIWAQPGQMPVRVATFNLALYGRAPGEILDRLNTGRDAQALALAEIIQRAHPDVLVLNEIDYDPHRQVLDAFCDKYLAARVPGASTSGEGSASSDERPSPLAYPYRYAAPSNTARHSGFDLDHNGKVDPTPGSRDYGSDCWGYGVYDGQYAFAILSRFPIDEAAIRTFQNFRWRDMPGAQLPDDPRTAAPDDWYSAQVLEKFPLSSKNHCDVPIVINGRRIHFLLSHPTPPAFDGPEHRNGRRNHDELRFWRDYVGDAKESEYIYDDAGEPGGLSAGSSVDRLPNANRLPPTFIVMGDLNGDPYDGQGVEGITDLLASPRLLKYSFPASEGAVEAARLQGGVNANHRGDARFDTEDAADQRGPGNLHLDYILPSADLKVAASAVFWPAANHPLHGLVAGDERPASSDHRLVWIDVGW